MKCSIKIFAILSTILLFTEFLSIGCAGISLSQKERDAISAISINREVIKPNEAFYYGPEQTAALTRALISATTKSGDRTNATSDEETYNGKQLAEFIIKEKINIGEIVVKSLEDQISETKVFTITNTGSEKATLKIEIRIYGLGQSTGFSSTLYPELGVLARLVKPDSTIIWQKYDLVTPQNSENKEGDTLENYFNDSRKLRSAFVNVSRIVARLLVADLAK